jgi:N-acetylglucosaminyldiphosphoundecaprenol N-acetyl-beta-D-mannosaminyltransferase
VCINPDKIDLVGLHFYRLCSNEVFKIFDRYIHEGGTHCIFIANAHTLNLAYEDPVYRQILNSADLLLNDGTGIRWAGRLFGNEFKENLVGTDLIPNYFRHRKGQKIKIYLLGGFKNVVSEAARRIAVQFPSIVVAGFHDGYFRENENSEIIREINEKHPHILLVGFGNPKQEIWISENAHELNVPICIGIGGLIDHFGGKLKRAPIWMRKLGIEWVQLLFQQPRLKWKRYIIGNPMFVIRITKNRFLK